MIAASIVTYKTDLNELQTCLDCLRLNKTITRIEIVDNSRSESIRDFVAANYAEVEYTPSDNVGYGAANNISIRKSIADVSCGLKYHLVLNSDVAFMPDVIDTLVGKLESDERVGLIMPAVVGRNGDPQSCCHPLPSPFDLLKHRFASKSMFGSWRRWYDILPQRVGRDINVPYMHGCFMLFRLDALKNVGLFDERFFMYPEDIDITRRVHAQYKTIVTPDVTIFHLHRAESRHSRKMLYIHATNMLRYFAKWGFLFDSQRRRFNRQLKDELGL